MEEAVAAMGADTEAVAAAARWVPVLGLVMESEDLTLVPVPYSLSPALIPGAAFQEAVRLAPALNTLYDAVSRDPVFLSRVLERTARADPFTSKLLRLHESVGRTNLELQPVTLGLFRSDYMLHQGDGAPRLQQIEFNTIAVAFAHLSSGISKVHRHLLETRASIEPQQLPDNLPALAMADAMMEAVRRSGVESNVVVMVVQPGERNSADQTGLEQHLWLRGRIRVLRRSLRDIGTASRLDDGTLMVSGLAVSLVYFRAGYAPTDYPSPIEWEGRKRIEESRAVKCPPVSYQLSGTKRVQQELCRKDVLKQFLDSETVDSLLLLFALQYNFEDQQHVDTIRNLVQQNPSGYVLKPQREGGGNNIYGQAIPSVLGSNVDLSQYVLMQRLFPPVSNARLCFPRREATTQPCISELGFYSCFLRQGDHVPINSYAGYLVRTKPEHIDEGGVASGYSVLNSVILVD